MPRLLESKTAMQFGFLILLICSAVTSSSAQIISHEVSTVRTQAEGGDASAQWNLGLLYERGNGIEQNYALAAEWYHKAAKQGFSDAQASLGNLYTLGRGVKRDYAKAAEWYRMAADQDNPFAQWQFSGLYYNGLGVRQDYAEAVKWMRKAADHGYVWAQIDLGNFFTQGKGIKQDFAEAYFWYRLAEKADLQYAYYAKKASTHLTGEQIATVEKRVKAWKRCPFRPEKPNPKTLPP